MEGVGIIIFYQKDTEIDENFNLVRVLLYSIKIRKYHIFIMIGYLLWESIIIIIIFVISLGITSFKTHIIRILPISFRIQCIIQTITMLTGELRVYSTSRRHIYHQI